MQIFDYAMQMEKDGEAYYRELAAKSGDRGIESILTMMADAERRHFEVLDRMKRGAASAVAGADMRTSAKNLFARLQKAGEGIDRGGGTVGLFRKAQELEKKSEDFYLAQAEKASGPDASALLLRLAKEEKLHFDMLESLVEFVSRPQPGNWLENAEWYHRDEY